MKKIPLLMVVIFAFSCSALIAQKRVTPAQARSQVLFDFRVERKSDLPRFPQATHDRVLSTVFRKYLTDENRCNRDFAVNDTDHLAAARKAGQIAPLIAAVVSGSFTAPGQTQTAYVIFVQECNASHADSYGTKRIAIFSGQQLVADVDSDFKGEVVRKTDLNSDGVDELLMTASDLNQGTMIEIASLVEFRDGRRRVIEDFGTVIEDSCATAMPGSSAKASVISMSDLAPGRMPKLRIDNYASSCRNVKRWRLVSTGKMQ